jgi:cytochrome c-type biogenesis protein CcmH
MSVIWRAAVAVLLSVLLTLSAAHAVTPDEILKDPALEARARDISQLLRCVVCQNQSIDDSSAPLAKDLRVLVRERLAAGDTNQQTMAYIVARYGNFVLLKPPMQFNTLLLWFGPALILALAAFAAFRFLQLQETAPSEMATTALDSADEARLAKLLGTTETRT